MKTLKQGLEEVQKIWSEIRRAHAACRTFVAAYQQVHGRTACTICGGKMQIEETDVSYLSQPECKLYVCGKCNNHRFVADA
ncbi:MAG: hypothetical protein GY854_19795 [Deltaproteobacteria bacterium]|nr:hypothetical protein [Deltaproteobacteria bacterium]